MVVNPICIEEEMILSQLHNTLKISKVRMIRSSFLAVTPDARNSYRFTFLVVCYAGSEDVVPGVQLH